jgi:hypothetical protein
MLTERRITMSAEADLPTQAIEDAELAGVAQAAPTRQEAP